MEHKNLGEYEILGTIGAGTVGTVYRARHQGTHDVVALKLLKGSVVTDQNVHERFVREVTILEKLEHENIVKYLECGFDQNTLYFTMEFIESGSLKEMLQGQVPWRDVADLGQQVCAGIGYAHAKGIVHRDLKPANLFLSKSGLVKIGDFGIALDVDRNRLTADGMTVGTCRYMAPEQIMADEITPQTDLYALGCILYQMLTGAFLFDGETEVAVIEQHLNATPPSIRDVNPHCPPELDSLIAQLLAKAPSDRPASADEVRQALSQMLAGETQEAASVATEDSPGDTDDAPTLNLTERLQGAAQGKSFDASWTTLALMFLAVVGVITVALVFRGS